MKLNKNLILRDPDDQGQAGGGGSGEGQQSSTAQSLFGQSAVQEADQSGGSAGAGRSDQGVGAGNSGAGSGTGGAASSGTGATPQLTPEQIRELAAGVARGMQPQQQPQMTEEEFNKLFNIVNPSEDQLGAIFGEDKKVALATLRELLHGTARQATTLAAFHLTQELQKIQQMVQPALKLAETQELDKLKGEFFEFAPDLKGLEPLLLEIRNSFIAQGKQFDNKDSAFKAVAEAARGILAKIPGYQVGQSGQSGNGNSGAGQGQQRQQQSTRMPALSGKGQGGGTTGGSSATKSTAERIFG